MLVSVVVPLYNKGEHIARALSSIATQRFAELECLVIDDGSTDDGPEIARAHGDARFRVLTQSNAGPGAARNRGIAEAQGDLVAFLDADDAWLPGYLEHAVRIFEELGEQVATVTSGYIDYPQKLSREALWRRRGLATGIHRVVPSTKATALGNVLVYMSPCSTVARTSVVRRWGGFHQSSRFAEDAVLWLKVLLNHPVHLSLEPLVCFHREASALSSNYTGARPIEPFLLDPDEVSAVCPSELQPLLRRFYAVRACKTAAMLGYWGQAREARRLLSRFVGPQDWRAPFLLPALAAATPFGGVLLRKAAAMHAALRADTTMARVRVENRPK
jgi:hypothetical protein